MQLRLAAMFALRFALAASADATGTEMPTTLRVRMDPQVFSITAPVAPEKQLAMHNSIVSLSDEKIFGQTDGTTLISVHWRYRTGLFGKIAGVLELQVFMRRAREIDVKTEDGLKQEVRAYVKRELSKVRYAGDFSPSDFVTINGRPWLRYQVPVLAVQEYSTALADKRFLTVQFAFIDNTGELSPAWRNEANELMRKLVSSVTIESLPAPKR